MLVFEGNGRWGMVGGTCIILIHAQEIGHISGLEFLHFFGFTKMDVSHKRLIMHCHATQVAQFGGSRCLDDLIKISRPQKCTHS